MININTIMNNLSVQRPIFHSEADFQHSLAWEIHRCFSNSFIRLELPWSRENKQKHLDILNGVGTNKVAIELKYKTRGLRVQINDETYSLKGQSAQDSGRYDFLKDVMRLEQLIEQNKGWTGIAIFLTNDSSYWKEPNTANTADASFRLHQGRSIQGALAWRIGAAEGTIKGREAPIILRNIYQVNWIDYSRPSIGGYGQFRYAIFQVS